MTLRLRVVLFTLAVLVPACVALGGLVAAAGDRDRLAFESRVRETTRALSMVLDRDLERRAGILQVLAASPQLQDWDLDSLCKLANAALLGAPGPIALRDSQRQYLNTTQPGCKVPADVVPVLQRSRTSPESQLTPLFAGSITHELMMLIDTPVVVKGREYFLGLGIRPAELQSMIDQQRLQPGWTAAILDSEGVVVARSPDPQKWLGKPGKDHARKSSEVDAGTSTALLPEGSMPGFDASGQAVQVFYSRLPRHGVTFFITVPAKQMGELGKRIVSEMIVLTFLMIVLACLFAYWVGDRVSRPIEALRDAGRDLQAGMPVLPIASGVSELAAIGSALVKASEANRHSTAVMNRRIAEAVAATEATQKQLLQSQKLETVGQLAGGVAHDFNNVLQTISTALHVLGALPQQVAARPVIEAGQRAVQRAARLVRQLLSLGRTPPLEPQPTDLRDLLLQMHDLLSCTLPPQLRLQTDLTPELWLIEADPAQLEVALLNLVFNARDATLGKGLVTISANNQSSNDGDWVVITVHDNGEGIAPHVLPRIFEPFFTTKEDGRGTGLGLAQVRRFASLSQGTVTAESILGQGSSVKLRLPRATRAVSQSLLDQAAGQLAGPCWLLFVEDDLLVAQVIVPALESAGFSVVHARSGDEALAMLRASTRFDLVFSDIMMPGSVDGLALARCLALDWPHIPVVLASAFASDVAQLPEVPVLVKPFSIQTLVTALVEALARHVRPSTN